MPCAWFLGTEMGSVLTEDPLHGPQRKTLMKQQLSYGSPSVGLQFCPYRVSAAAPGPRVAPPGQLLALAGPQAAGDCGAQPGKARGQQPLL